MSRNTKGLFPITQVAHACGISRSTLMRMEEKGLLTPAYTAPESGRRYYDCHSIARILQILQFHTMGFSAEETAAYFYRDGEAGALLSVLEGRLALLERNVEEMQMRSMKIPNLSVKLLRLPETVCCVREHGAGTYQEKYDAMYSLYHECVENGFMLAGKPLFTVNKHTDYLLENPLASASPFQVCVPILPETAPADAVRFPACTALSVLFYGYDHDVYREAWRILGREVKARGLTPAAFPRTLGIVAPYTGREIDPKRYCSRIALPVEE